MRAERRDCLAASRTEGRSAGASAGGRSGKELSSPPSWIVITNGGMRSRAGARPQPAGHVAQGVGAGVVRPGDHDAAGTEAAQVAGHGGARVRAGIAHQEELRDLLPRREPLDSPPHLPGDVRFRCGATPSPTG